MYWCREKDLNLRRHCRQIYSLLPLAARASRQIDYLVDCLVDCLAQTISSRCDATRWLRAAES